LIEGSEVVSLECSASALDAMFFMKSRNIRRVVITCDGKPAGLFTVDEALRQILFSTETRLRDVKLKPLVYVKANEPREIATAMVKNNVDAVLYKDTIVTEKDVVFSMSWGSEKVSLLARSAITVESFTSVSTAIEIMTTHSIRHLPVVEKEPRGMISARDIVYFYVDKLEVDVSVSQVMSPGLVAVDEGSTLNRAVNLMKNKNIGSLYVNGKKIITLKDFIKYLANV
jgi:CBS domain-containing protein